LLLFGVASLPNKNNRKFSLAAAKARVALVTVLLCREMGFPWNHLEGNARGVIEAVKNEATNYNKVGHLVEDIKLSLQNFLQWKIDFVRRGSNYAAHCLAKLAVRIWMPDCIRDTVLLEQTALVA
jgi:hypothetical protein